MGRRPTPTALKVMRGERKDRINFDEPQPADGPLECPDDVSDAVREIWDYTRSNLIAMGIASRTDREALLCYCEAVVVHRAASKILAEQEAIVEDHRGIMVRNPAFAMQRDAALLIKAYAREFGFTPAARSEIRKGAAAPDAAARYLNAV